MPIDEVDEAAEETFPAGDAPTWSGMHAGSPAAEPAILVEHREELIYLLSEAAEIEHGLMCCYLYAAWSLAPDAPGLRDVERAAIVRWRKVILEVARDEMVHLALVSNLLAAVGSAPHFMRQNFPVSPGYHPAGVVVSLAPFDLATLDHFVFLERPEGMSLPDGRGFVAPFPYQRGVKQGRLVPTAQDYSTVGHLYRGLRAGLSTLAAKLGEAALLSGDPRLQIGPELLPLAGMAKVTSLETAFAAIDTIVHQGEGSSKETETSHFTKFTAVRDELRTLLAERPDFAPALPVARNPVMRRPPIAEDRVWICAEPAATTLDLGNAAYALMLRALGALFSPIALADDARAVLADLSVTAMFLMTTLAERLARLPANTPPNGVNAGLTFTMSRSIHPPLDARALRGVAEVARAVASGLKAALPDVAADDVEGRAKGLLAIAERLEGMSSRPVASPGPAALPVAASSAPTAAPAATSAVEVAKGKSLTVLFEAKRCIHSRHCVLDAPRVFLANTPGEWIFPDQASTETLIGVAHACPSGAIRYERNDGGAEEAAPPVSSGRIRENGPLAIHADIDLRGHGRLFRATLCRCGGSKNKPFCDGTHNQIGFTATGEPPTTAPDALAERGGALVITPRKNGNLGVRGNLELCAGTGRVVARFTSANLCRCGASQKKPFCDGTHAKIGFVADGE